MSKKILYTYNGSVQSSQNHTTIYTLEEFVEAYNQGDIHELAILEVVE